MAEEVAPSHTQETLEALHGRLDKIEGRMDELDRARAFFRNLGYLKLALSALTAGMVGFWGPVLAVMAVVEGPVPGTAWLIGVGAACIALAKDLRSQLDLPPAPTNGGVALPRLSKGGKP